MSTESGSRIEKNPDEPDNHELGRSRGGIGTKIHLATDAAGLPPSFCLSGGQAHESQYAKTLLNQIGIIHTSGCLKSRPKAVLADKGEGRTRQSQLTN
ncbi:transposase [Yersinia vastinensis]|uniref:transposase n=1 Tax=Yersinia vastinensis TaxID=2890318 RepID=UPI0011A56F2A|nr:transposase [Yersinia vastinensis]